MQAVLKTAHSWCFDGPDCMLSRPSQYALSRFQGPAGDMTGKQRVFKPHKNPRSLKSYFAIAPRFLAYVCRITQEDHCHFDVEEDSHGPEDVVEMTVGQQRAWQAVLDCAFQLHNELEYGSSSEDEVENGESGSGRGDRPSQSLEDRLVNFWMLLVCHNTAARRYTSPLVSFCAMLSIQLSKMIWIVQLIILYHSAQQERRGEGQTLTSIRE